MARKTQPNLPNENHTTQIELDQSKAFMVQSKQMVNNVFQVEKVTMTTVLEHQRYSVENRSFVFESFSCKAKEIKIIGVLLFDFL